MTTLIAGRFQQLSSAHTTSQELGHAGFSPQQMAVVYVSSQGQHAIHPVGGDEGESKGTHGASSGAARGAVGGAGAGTLVGVASLAVLGPVGPLVGAAVGAYAGALMGALKNMEESGEPHDPDAQHAQHAQPTAVMPREPGVLLVVAPQTPTQRDSAIEILGASALEVEETEGTLRDGDWVDFDPLIPGKVIG